MGIRCTGCLDLKMSKSWTLKSRKDGVLSRTRVETGVRTTLWSSAGLWPQDHSGPSSCGGLRKENRCRNRQSRSKLVCIGCFGVRYMSLFMYTSKINI